MPDFKLIKHNIGGELLSHCSTCWGQCVPRAVCPAQTAALPGKGWWDAGTSPAVLGPHCLLCWDHIASAQLACEKSSVFVGHHGLSVSANRWKVLLLSSHVLHSTGKVQDAGKTVTQSEADTAAASCTGVLEEQPLLFQPWDTYFPLN